MNSTYIEFLVVVVVVVDDGNIKNPPQKVCYTVEKGRARFYIYLVPRLFVLLFFFSNIPNSISSLRGCRIFMYFQ